MIPALLVAGLLEAPLPHPSAMASAVLMSIHQSTVPLADGMKATVEDAFGAAALALENAVVGALAEQAPAWRAT